MLGFPENLRLVLADKIPVLNSSGGSEAEGKAEKLFCVGLGGGSRYRIIECPNYRESEWYRGTVYTAVSK